MGTVDIDFAEITRGIDLVALVAQDTKLRPARRGQEYRGRCPLHKGDNPSAFSVFQGDDTRWCYYCFACGAKGDALNYIRERYGLSLLDAIEQYSNHRLPQAAPIPPRPRTRALPPREAAIDHYHNNLHCSTSAGISAWQQWSQIVSPKTINRFRLGYAKRCPTYCTSDSLTIPITYQDQVYNIRHRLLQPTNPKDKYRPQKADLGIHLFNKDSLDLAGNDVLIVEGEKKVLTLVDRDVETLMPVVSSTGGVSSWLGGYGEDWYELLMDFRNVYVLFDNERNAQQQAERTARLFGRRGYVVPIPGKVDDVIVKDEQYGLSMLISSIGNARPVLRSGYWRGVKI